MSLIRANSNPEGMYVFGSVQGMEIMSGRGWHLSNTGPDEDPNTRAMIVPDDTFYRLCKKADYICYTDPPVEVDGLRVQEQHVFFKTGRPVPEERSFKTALRRGAAETEFLIKLTYGNKYVFMYRVTWEYIRRNAIAQERLDREFAKKSRRSKAKKRVAASI